MTGWPHGRGAHATARFLAGAAAAALLLGLLPPAAAAQERWSRAAGLPYQKLIERVADRHHLNRHLLAALVEVESARRSDAVSPKGARGLGQLMPGTARRFGVQDPHDPEDNLEGAAQYLKMLIGRYGGDLALALAAYNAGEAAVDKYGNIPPYPETIGYVQKVLERAGLKRRARVETAGAPEPVRVERGQRGLPLLTNVP